MHPTIIYELVKIRMEQDRKAASRRLAKTEMPRVMRSSASSRPPGKRRLHAIARHSWLMGFVP